MLRSSINRPAAAFLAALLAPCVAFAQTGSNSAPTTSSTPTPILIGVVICTQMEPGDTASGTVVTNPQAYAGVPGLQVVQATVPLITNAQGGASLSGVVVDTGDNKKQPAQNPLLLHIAQNAQQIVMKFLTPNSDTPVAQETMPIAPPPPTETTVPTLATAVPSDYTTPPVYTSGAVEVIHGPVSGNSQLTQVLMDDQPCNIVAETPRSIMLTPPQGTAAGLHKLTVKEGTRTLTTFHVGLVTLLLSADDLHLVDGQSTEIHATIDAKSIPDSAWKAGFEKDLVSAQQLAADGIASSTWSAGKPGVIALHVVNNSPDTVVLSDAKNNQLTQLLARESFSKGPYTFNGKLKSLHGGPFDINVSIVPLLAPIQGEAAIQ
jgi:hypothetical protein